eukprot:299192_1
MMSLFFSFVLLFLLTLFVIDYCRPTVGVIRCDLYNQINGSYTKESNWSYIELLPQQFHYRLPFYATIANNNQNISFNEQQQSIIDQEILYANKSGIDYWSFVTYPPSPSQSDYGMNLYLTSKYVNLLKFNMIFGPSIFCNIDAIINYALPLFKQSTYLNVLDIPRPLLYLFNIRPTSCNNNASNIIAYIRQYVMKMGLNNPYIVILEASVSGAQQTMNELGLDAISLYAWSGNENDAPSPFSLLPKQMHYWWNQCKVSNNCSIITPIPIGWDPRPINLNPPPWLPNGEGQHWYYYPNRTELINYISEGINFTCSNKNGVAKAQSLLIYSWD